MWEMTPKAEIISTKYHKSIIKSKVGIFLLLLVPHQITYRILISSQILTHMEPNTQVMNFVWHFLVFSGFKAALTYAEAQMRIDDPSQNDGVTQGLRRLNSLAKILKRRRIDNG